MLCPMEQVGLTSDGQLEPEGKSSMCLTWGVRKLGYFSTHLQSSLVAPSGQ